MKIKVEEPEFKPVTITLETRGELEILDDLLYIAAVRASYWNTTPTNLAIVELVEKMFEAVGELTGPDTEPYPRHFRSEKIELYYK